MFVHPPIHPSQSYRGGPPLQAQEEEEEGKHDFRKAAADVLGGFGTHGGGRSSVSHWHTGRHKFGSFFRGETDLDVNNFFPLGAPQRIWTGGPSSLPASYSTVVRKEEPSLAGPALIREEEVRLIICYVRTTSTLNIAKTFIEHTYY